MTTENESDRKKPEPDARVRTLASADLLQGRREVLIDHDGQIYRLRLTKSGKLLLQK